MGKRYGHVTIEERCEIACLQAKGRSIRQIAAALDRSPSTVARELKRNGSQTGAYKPVYADQQARARRWRGSRMERDDTLRTRVLSRLERGWSPEQVAGRFKLEAGRRVISHESIYRFIYGQLARTKDYGWRHYLPRAKSKRGWRGRRGGSPASFMAMRRPIAERPQSAADRRTPGHWEADLMLFRTYGHAVLIMYERHSRILIAVRPPGKASSPIASAMSQVLGQLPAQWRRTVTFDNGTEFAEFALHYRLHDLGIETFFCDTHSPWQKGGVENAIGRLRRTLPRKTDLAALPMEPDLRQRDRVRPPLPTPRSGYRNLLLRYPLSLAEGRGGERHRPVAADSAPQDRPGGVADGAVYTDDSGLQQYPAKVPELQDPGRNILGKRVALEM